MKPPRPEPGDRIVDRCDATGTLVLQKPSGERQVGRFAPVVEGQAVPPHGEYLIYAHRDGEIYDVTPLRGPSKANSTAYRAGYDRVFSKTTVLN